MIMKFPMLFAFASLTLFSTTNGDLAYFTKLCHDFALARGQFSVLTVGKIKAGYDYSPKPIQVDLAKQNGNYLYAVPKSTPPKKHSEEIILDKLDEALKWYKAKFPTTLPDIYLFSINSPCNDKCAALIASTFTQYRSKINTMNVGWHLSYIPNPEVTTEDKTKMAQAKLDFQLSLGTLFTAGIGITWSSEGICQSANRGLSFQQRLYNCVISKCSDYKKYRKCTTLERFKQDLARVINKLVWDCTNLKKSEDPACYVDGLKDLEIPSPAKCNLAGNFLMCMPAFHVMLGPPIDPMAADVPKQISSSLDDLKVDNYKEFCMKK